MKNPLSLLLAILVPFALSAGPNPFLGVVAKKKAPGGPTFLVNEGFEGTGAPTNWFMGGSADPDSTASPLAGSQSLRVPTGATNQGVYGVSTPMAQNEIYVKFKVKFSNLPASFAIFFQIENGLTTNLLQLYLMSDGTVTVDDGTGATIFATTVSAMSAGTVYDVEAHYKKGTGATGVCSVGFVASGGAIPTSGNAFAGGTNSPQTAQADDLHFSGITGGVPNIDFDTVQAAITFIP